MGMKNRLISADNKGYAEELFETNKGIVSAFANSCCGDNSPNMKYGRPDGVHDFERTVEFGTKQYIKAVQLFDDAVEELTGSIDYRQTYVDMNHCLIEGEEGKRTWPAAMGLGMSKGSMEDSTGPGFWSEGVRRSDVGDIPRLVDTILGLLSILYGVQWPLSLDDDYVEGHGEKPVLFPWGLARDNGLAMIPHILPLQIIKLGSLALIAHPGEITTMAGRRLRKTVLDILNGAGVNHAVVAAYAGAFCSYTTTAEEYDIQCYEGASTLYGPWTLQAYQQENARLARAMKNDKPVPSGQQPPDYSSKFTSRDTGVRPRRKPLGANFGDVEIQPAKFYKRGEEAVVSFWGGHANNHFTAGQSLLFIERKEGGDWQEVYRDREFCTIFRCKRRGDDLIAEVKWKIPVNQKPGTYRIRYQGYWKSAPKRLHPIAGLSNEFTVT